MKLVPRIFLALALFPEILFSLPTYGEITERGDRNIRIIFSIYEKYPFMPAKKEFYNNLESKWLKDKTTYRQVSGPDRQMALEQLYATYKMTNEVLKDICIDMAHLTDTLMDDFSEKMVDIEAKRIPVKNDRYHNRFIVSRRQFTRAQQGFKNSMYYYSASLYDHGIELLISVYRDNNWEFPGLPGLARNPEKKESLS